MTWERSPQPTAAAWTVLAVLAAVGCGDDTTDGGGGNGGGNGGEPQGGNGGEPQGGDGGNGGEPQGGNGGDGGGGGPPTCSLDGFNDVAEGNTPFDATPSPDGCTIYFTAYDAAAEQAGVYSTDADGGSGVIALEEGGELVSPFGIATNADGDTLYIADPAADEDDSDRGLVFSLPSSGGTLAAVAGSAGLSPRSLEVRTEGGADQIYFTGRTAAGLPAVYKLAGAGGTAAALFTGETSSDFSGITLASNGDVYFVDTSGTTSGAARIMLLESGSGDATPLALEDLRVGYPAGLAITLDDQTLWLSGLDPATLTDVVFQIDVDTLTIVRNTGDPDTLTNFSESAGLHRAKNIDIFAWADSRAGAGGTVFAIQP